MSSSSSAGRSSGAAATAMLSERFAPRSRRNVVYGMMHVRVHVHAEELAAALDGPDHR